MRFVLMLMLGFASAGAGAAEAGRFGMGLGLETRLQREVNPGFAELKNAVQIFQEFSFHPVTLVLEFGYERRSSADGGLEIETQTASAGAWGRYSFAQPGRWSPFVAGGMGAYMDRVLSRFQAESDHRQGTRLFAGLGGGISRVFGRAFLVEAEARTGVVQDRRDPMLSLIVRAGVQL